MNSKKILIFPFNLLSHYLRCIVLANSYKEYEIVFAYSAEYNSFIEKAGYKTFKVAQFNAEEVLIDAKKFRFSWLNKKNIESIFLSQVKIIQELKPIMVIGDASPTLKMAAQYTNVKYVSLMNAYMSPHYAGERVLSTTHFMYPFLKPLPLKFTNTITSIAETVSFKWIHHPFKQIRKKYSLPSISNYLNEQEGDDTLICDSPHLFPLKTLPTNYKVIGALFYLTEESEEKLINKLDKTKPSICICLGSSGQTHQLNFLSNTEYAKYNIVIVGNNMSTINGRHIFYQKFANLDKLLPHCSLLICHGGNGTIYWGVKHNIYMLCITSHFEQEWNVHQIQKNGLGKLINASPKKFIDTYLRQNIK